jgi:hypothetical protein
MKIPFFPAWKIVIPKYAALWTSLDRKHLLRLNYLKNPCHHWDATAVMSLKYTAMVEDLPAALVHGPRLLVITNVCYGPHRTCFNCSKLHTKRSRHDMAPDIPLGPLSKPANYSRDLATRAKWIPTASALDHAVDLIYPPYKPSDEEQHNQPNLDTDLQQSGLLFPWPATTELSHPSSSSSLVEVNPELLKSKSKQHDTSETLDPEARKRLKSRIAQRKTRKFSFSALRMETYYFSDIL